MASVVLLEFGSWFPEFARAHPSYFLSEFESSLPGFARAHPGLRNAEVLADQRVVFACLRRGSCENDAAGVEQHRVVGKREGEVHVLLDEQDRLAFRLEPRDG